MKKTAMLAGGVALLALSLNAQEVRTFAFAGAAGIPQTFEFMSAGMAMEGKLVKGAPYSAEASNESVQTLADGNRIVHRNTSKLYRDSEGRTRREQTLDSIGPFAASGRARQMIFINDPVAGVSYTLDPEAKTARRVPVIKFSGDGHEIGLRLDVEAFSSGTATGTANGNVIISRSIERHAAAGPSANVSKEELGKRSFEGVEAQGNRSTLTIPAGQMGNEQPLRVVTESWYSGDLQLTVSSETRDPRMGTSSYRLSNINRSEQPRFLFEVPSDYSLQEEPKPAMRIKKEMM